MSFQVSLLCSDTKLSVVKLPIREFYDLGMRAMVVAEEHDILRGDLPGGQIVERTR